MKVFSFLMIGMFLILFTLKLCGVIALCWWWVVAPLLVLLFPIAAVSIITLLAVIVGFLVVFVTLILVLLKVVLVIPLLVLLVPFAFTFAVIENIVEGKTKLKFKKTQ